VLRRAGSAYRRFEESLEGLSEEEAVLDTDPSWRRYEHGDGLDGSIRGIVRHVALWKQIAADGLASGVFPEPSSRAWPEEWTALVAWLEEGQRRLIATAAEISPEALEEEVVWLGHRMSRATLIGNMTEHDQYHAGQVNLIRQLRQRG
jgi:uncharacterized damage-inducible protein DinB